MNSSVSEKKMPDSGRLPVITCSFCGVKILFVSNAKVMGEAIENHVEEHVKKIKDPAQGAAESERIHVDLISQVFDKASKK
jgi:hypothetical protein